MSYTIKLHPKVNKFLDKLDYILSSKLKKRLKLLKEEPFRFLEHYETDSCYKFRLGEYRALIDIETKQKIVFVRVLDHRSRIYKRK
jgi:mRNA-degrading endonuclease RelE of RelBE toxin-antitoxin system